MLLTSAGCKSVKYEVAPNTSESGNERKGERNRKEKHTYLGIQAGLAALLLRGFLVIQVDQSLPRNL